MCKLEYTHSRGGQSLSNHYTICSKIIPKIFFVALLAVSGLASCGGGGGGNNATPAALTVPTVTVTASPASIPYNSATTITWSSTDSLACSSPGGGGVGTSGSFTQILTSTTTYVVTCTGPGGITSQIVTITVAPPASTAPFSGFTIPSAGVVTVNSTNALTENAIVTIGGTTNLNNTYTATNVNSAGFNIAATPVGGSQSGTWALTGGMLPGCSTTGSTGAITLSNIPSRFSGVAPLSVFFDATGTTATGTTRPFHDLEYRWSFGDAAGSPISGTTWNTGSSAGVSSRNAATGPVAGHVFETPGIYTVTLSATDGTSTVSNNCAQIVVQYPDAVFSGANTICVAAASLPVQGVGGCPASASVAQEPNFATAISSYATTGKRVLFKRGDTFTTNAISTISAAGPGIIGAYGAGALPLIAMSPISRYASILRLSTVGSDWRVMDLAFDGAGTTDQFGIGYSTAPAKITILRLTATNLMADVTFTGADQIAVADSNFTLGGTGSTGSNIGVYCETCTNVMLLGNSMYLNTINSHNIRLQGVVNFVVSNSTQTGSNLIEPITVRGNTQYGVLSDNKFVDNIVTVKPQNTATNELQRDVIFDRNWFVAGAHTIPSLTLSGSGITVRNNIFDLSLASGYRAISIGKSTASPMPDLINIYNNTVYNSFANNGNLFSFIAFNYDNTLNATCHSNVENNLAYSPNTTGLAPALLANTGGCIVTGANGTLGNSSDAQIKNTSPGFTSATPANPIDFSLGAGSYARDTGVTIPVFSDFFRTARPQGAAIDKGAVEGP